MPCISSSVVTGTVIWHHRFLVSSASCALKFSGVLHPMQLWQGLWLEARVKEHRDACQNGALENSALAEQTLKNYHPIKWEEVSVVDRAKTAKELLVKEAIHIWLSHPSLNKDGALELPGCWMGALKSTVNQNRPKNWPVVPTDSSSDSTCWDARL